MKFKTGEWVQMILAGIMGIGAAVNAFVPVVTAKAVRVGEVATPTPGTVIRALPPQEFLIPRYDGNASLIVGIATFIAICACIYVIGSIIYQHRAKE